MKKHTHMMIACVLMVLFTGKFKAQLSGVYNIPGDYATIGAAINDLNIFGVTGAVTVNIAAGHTETATVGGYALNSVIGASNSNQIIFRKNGVGANPLITAYTGTATPSSVQQDGVWSFLGTDFVTIDGVDIMDPNTTNPGTMEFGYGFFKANSVDGCQNNTIKNCVITLSRVNNDAGSGPARAGSRGIDVVNATSTAHTTGLTITSAAGTNSNNKFYSNTIQNCNMGISIIGFTAASPYTFADSGNDIGGNSISTGNMIVNFGGGGGNATAAVESMAQYDFNVSYNLIDNNNGSGVLSAQVLRGVYIGAADNANLTINNNTLSLKGGGTTQQLSGIETISSGAGTTNTTNINNNMIVNGSNATNTSGSYYGIWNSCSTRNLSISNNTFSNNTTNATSATIYFIYNNGTVAGSNQMNNNQLSNAFTNTTVARSGTTYYVYNAGGSTTTTLSISGNQFTNISYQPTPVSTGVVYYVYNITSCAVNNLNNNTWNNLTVNTSGSNYLIYNSTSTQNALSVSNNSIVTGYTRQAASGTFYCYYSGASSLGTSTQLFTGNNFSNITSTVSGAGIFYGIYTSDGSAAPSPRKTIFNNIVSNINYNSTASNYGMFLNYLGSGSSASASAVYNNTVSNVTFAGTSYGFYTSSSGTPDRVANIYNNTVSDFTTTGAASAIYGLYVVSPAIGVNYYGNKAANIYGMGATGSAFGLYISSGTNVRVYNNIIGGVYTPVASGTNRANGIYINGGTSMFLYFNSVYLDGTSTGAAFSSNAFYSSTTPSLTLNNNIFINKSIPTGAGTAVAFRRSSTTLTTYMGSSDKNLYYAGVPSATTLIFHDGTNSMQTLANLQTLLVNRDLTSVTEDPPFISTIPAAANFLNVNSTPNTLIESGATSIPGITTDFGGNTRNGSAPDIGAWEGNFGNTNPACAGAPSAGVSAISSAQGCPNTLFTVSNSGQTPGSQTGIQYQWQSSSSATGPWTNVPGSSASFQSSVSATTYYQLVVTCANGGASATTTPVSYSVAGDACICTPYVTAANNCSFDYISNVTFGTINRSSACDVYTVYSSPSPSFTAGQSYVISVSTGGDTEGAMAWIDYNANGVFDMPAETVLGPLYAGTNPATYTALVNIPVGATPGLTRLRVRCNFAAAPSGPTTTQTYGETEDYCINILPPVSCAGAPASGTAAINVSGGCANQAVTLTGLGLTSGVGITYQWQSASNIAGPYTAVAGATNATLPQTVSTDSYYQVVTTCAGSGLTATSSPIGYIVNTCAGSFTLTDSYGDGWNGATMNLVVGTSTFALGSGFTGGASQIVNLCIPANSNFSLYMGATGAYPTEVGITASMGGSIVTNIVGANTGGPLTSATTGSLLSSGVTCPNCSSASGGTLSVAASTICTTSNVNLNVNGATNAGGITYAWQTAPTAGGAYVNVSTGTGSNSVSYTTPTVAPGTYFYRLQATCNGSLTGASDEATVTVLGTNTPSFTTSAPAACNGGSVALIGAGATNYTWSTGATGSSIAITPTASANYFVIGGNGVCPDVTSSQIPVYYSLNPNVTATSASTVICAGIQATLTGGGAATYSWTDGSNTISGVTVNPTPSVTTTYTVTGYKLNGCNSTATLNMPVNPTPNIMFSGSSGICTGQTATIIASGANTYTWNTGSNSATITDTPPTGTSVYTVTGETALGCKAVATQTLNVAASLSISIAGPNAICVGDAVTLTGQGGVTYTWNTSATTQTIADSPTVTTTYSIIGASGTCSNTAVKTITVNSIPVVSVVGNNTICIGQTASLTASGANTYSWTTTTTGATVGVFPPSTAMYTVYGTSTANCTGNQTVMVTVNPLPTVSIASSAASVCVSSPASFTASGANTYSWVNGPTTADYTVTPTAAAVYTVIGTSTAGCVSSRTVALGSYTLPVVSIAPSSASICLNSLGTFVASGASTYTWNAAPTNTSATFTVVPSGNTVYTVVASTTAGCIGSQTVAVTSYSLPAMVITPASATVCANSFTNFVASGAVTYTWTNGPQTAAFNFFHSTSITHTVTGTNPEGCKASETVAVLANPLPTLVSVPAFTTVCANSTVNFNASGADTFTWNAGAVTGSNVSIVTPTASTTYTLAGTNSFGCSSSTVVPIIVNALPVVNITPATATVCSLSSVNFTASGANSYTWNGTVFTATVSLTPTVNATYTVVATNTTTGCQNSKTVSVVANALPSLTITPSAASVCVGSDATLNVTGATTYTWGDGSNATTLTVTPSGTSNYSVTGVNQNGCVSSKSISIGNYALPTLVLTPSNQVVCAGEVGSYTVSGATSYTWEPGALAGTEYTASPLTTSFYTVTGKDANSCVSALNFILTIDKCTGIKESAINSELIKLFPNPSNGIITADFGFEGIKNVVIMSSTGAVITNHTTSNQQETFDLSELSKGVYFIRVSSKQASGNYKVVVQ